eukprot:6482361-Amphidinium_carterae.1
MTANALALHDCQSSPPENALAHNDCQSSPPETALALKQFTCMTRATLQEETLHSPKDMAP